MYYFGAGSLYLGARAADGGALPLRPVGNCSALTLIPGADPSMRIGRTPGGPIAVPGALRGARPRLRMTIDSLTRENLAAALSGEASSIPGGSAARHRLPAGIEAGDFISLPHLNVSVVSILDSSRRARPLPLSQWRANGPMGSIEFLDVTTGGPYEQPFTATYTWRPHAVVGIAQAAGEFSLRFEGKNLAQPGTVAVLELFRVALSSADLPLISEGFSELQIEAAALPDPARPALGLLGQFGRLMTN